MGAASIGGIDSCFINHPFEPSTSWSSHDIRNKIEKKLIIAYKSFESKQYLKAVELFKEFELYYDSTGYPKGKFSSKIKIAMSYAGLGDIQSSANYMKQALNGIELYEQNTKGKIYSNLGALYDILDSTEQTKHYLLKGLHIVNNGEDFKLKLALLTNLAAIYLEEDSSVNAYYYLLESKIIGESINDTNSLVSTYSNLGLYHDMEGNADSTLIYYRKALSLIKDETWLDQKIDVFENLMMYYIKNSSEDSTHYYYYLLYDALEKKFNLFNAKEIAKMEAYYDLKDKEYRLNTALREKQLAELAEKAKRNENYILRLSVILAVFVIAFVLIVYLQNRKNNKLKLLQAEDKRRKLIDEQQKELINTKLETTRRERDRIAMDLHDKVGGGLATMKLKTQTVEELPKEKKNELISYLNEIIKDVRHISHDLRSKNSDLSIKSIMHYLCESVNQSGALNMEMYCSIKCKLSDKLRDDIYLVILELTNNTIKHSGAETLSLQLIERDEVIYINFEDDGCGMDLNFNGGGIGIKNVRDRLSNIDGEIEIDSARNKGFRASINIRL